jgi:hypothetical protein
VEHQGFEVPFRVVYDGPAGVFSVISCPEDGMDGRHIQVLE